MRVRVVSGLIGSVILIAALLAPPGVLTLVVFGASLLAIFEFRQAVQSVQRTVDPTVAILMTVMLVGNSRYGNPSVVAALRASVPAGDAGSFLQAAVDAMSWCFSGSAVRVVAFACIAWLFGRLIFQMETFHLDDLAMTVTGVLYIPFLMSFVTQVRGMGHGAWLVWLIVFGAVITDTAAYFVGVTLGRHKLLPKVSPKKTVEGGVGGVVGCTAVMLAFGLLVPAPVREAVPWYHFLILGVLCGVVSQLGDWSASAIKRSAGIKDFGKLIPGHGGMLDRIDSILFVGPVVFLYLQAVVGL